MDALLLEEIRLPLPDDPLAVREDQALLLRHGRIAALGPREAVAARAGDAPRRKLDGALVTPGLIDAHTHLVWAGSRASEHAERLRGRSYEDIARAGGGIRSTVRAVQRASDETLLAAAVARARVLADEGVTTIEVKSGYGLTVADELRCLRVARRIAEHVPVRITTTLLAAHAVPEGMTAERWIDVVTRDLIPAAAREKLADAVDVFCEGIGFSVAQCDRVFRAAQEHGLAIKAHAEQLSDLGGAAAAARLGALSADHLEHLRPEHAAELAAAGTVATLLPLAWYHLGDTTLPPVAALRRAGVKMAVATDANPGSAPLLSLRLAAHMACHHFGLRPDEAWLGITRHAADALGMPHRGRLAVGARADLAVWRAATPADIVCEVGTPLLVGRVLAGRWQGEADAARA